MLVAANTGAPLDAAASSRCRTLRASAKRAEDEPEGAVGRFGVGFAAVLAVSDEPAVVGRHGGVRWSLAEARDAGRRARPRAPARAWTTNYGAATVTCRCCGCRCPPRAPPRTGYDTVVILPLRDGAAEDLAQRLLAAIDDALLLTLPGLAEVVIETPDGTRTLTRTAHGPYVHIEDTAAATAQDPGTSRWRTVR